MTKKITCTLPNASEEISGVKFAAVEDAMVATGVEDAVAAQFSGINGYTVEDEDPKIPASTGKKKAAPVVEPVAPVVEPVVEPVAPIVEPVSEESK